MPLYDFTCKACGERFEVMSSSDQLDENAVCPACGARDVTRVFTSFTVGGHKGQFNPGNFVKPGKGIPAVHRT